MLPFHTALISQLFHPLRNELLKNEMEDAGISGG